MSATPSLKPIGDKEFGTSQARHLLNRAGFGGTNKQIQMLVDRGLDDAVDLLVDYEGIDTSKLPEPKLDQDIIRPPTREERQRIVKARRNKDQDFLDEVRAENNRRRAQDRAQQGTLEQWWLARLISTPRPMEEKLVLLWHDHFASRHRNVRDSYLMYLQNKLFREHANHNFGTLAKAIVRDPAMIKFLNNDRNFKAKPNENLARELMELFTLGEGNYTENDIKQGARALTGYTYRDNEFVKNKNQHDGGRKTILGKSGNFDADDFVEILLKNDACPKFVAYKLYNQFVLDTEDHPSEKWQGVVNQLALQLKRSNYEIKPVVKTLLKSQHFYDSFIVGNKIKSPAQFTAGTIRMLNTPTRDISILTDAMSMMGQKLFEPPSVAGWDEGRAWINTSTLFVRQNTSAYLITGKLPFEDKWTTARINYEPTQMLEGLESRLGEQVVDHLVGSLLASPLSSQRRDELIQFANSHGSEVNSGTMLGLLLLITSMPEYQLC